MRILYLCKRQYMSHDVIEDRYARLYEQPFQLAQLGNDVLGVCLSYRNCTEKDETHSTTRGSLRWIGLSPGKLYLALFGYPRALLKITKQFKPDIIIGASDCLHIILAFQIAKKLNVKFAADLYDHFESFGLAKIPFVKYFYRRALERASVISCVSQSLSKHIQNEISPHAVVFCLPSTINQSIFYPRDKTAVREKFNLPINVPIIGTAGGLTKNKGIATVYQAFIELTQKRSDIVCVIAGQIDKTCPPPSHERIIHLGMLPHTKIGELFCALDVGIVYLRDTKYGRFSFPQKAYEMAACKIPMVVADIGDMAYIFSRQRNELYTAENTDELCKSIIGQLEEPNIPELHIENWEEQAKLLDTTYTKICNTHL